jgi:Transcriptional regulator SbtR-like, C-terminal domain
LKPIVHGIVERAQAEGSLRSDVGPTDLVLLDFLLGLMIDHAGRVDPDIVRRTFRIVMDGLRSQRRQPSRLSGRPPSEATMDRVLTGAYRPLERPQEPDEAQRFPPVLR